MKRLALLSLLAMLAGCGISGGLERPDPMWNRDTAQAAEHRREEEERREREALRQHRAIPTQNSTEPSPNQPPTSSTTPQ